jgi:hypothetical protein
MSSYRIYKVEELKALPEGTKFCHSTLGDCVIVSDKGKMRMEFRDKKISYAVFCYNDYPWNEPLKMLEKTESSRNE